MSMTMDGDGETDAGRAERWSRISGPGGFLFGPGSPAGTTMVALLVAAVLLGFSGLRGAGAQSPDDNGLEARYLAATPKDSITRLQDQIDRGQVKLEHDPVRGYLPSVLRQLQIPASSQMLVFSKTSFQRDRISPEAPRALYFNDDTYIGWVQGGPVLEVSTVDPDLGAVFYLLSQQKGQAPRFQRQSYECLQCHNSPMTKGVPGHIMRSVFPDPSGQPIYSAGTFVTTDQSPLNERWGGWYVTGTHGRQRHLGNLLVKDGDDANNPARLNLSATGNITDLHRLVNTAPYLTRHSDIVALMVAEHQTQVQDLISRAHYETAEALRYDQEMNKALGRPVDYRSDSAVRRIQSVCEPLLKAMLMVDEAVLTDPVAGTSGFAAHFSSLGPRDKQNQSLRELDLKQRLFKYPCSYLIYSPAFGALPDPAKAYLYQRLWEVLSGEEKSPAFARLSDSDRKAVLEILLETHPEFAAWKAHHRPGV